MRNDLPKRFKDNIEERPKNLSKRKDAQVYDDLANTLEVLDVSKAVVLAESEAVALFGKYFKTSLRANLKKRGIIKPRIAVRDGKAHIWCTKI